MDLRPITKSMTYADEEETNTSPTPLYLELPGAVWSSPVEEPMEVLPVAHKKVAVEAPVAEVVSTSEQDNSEYLNKVESLESQLAWYRTQLTQTQSQLQSERLSNDSAKRELIVLSAQVRDLGDSLSLLDEMRIQLETLEVENEDLQKQISSRDRVVVSTISVQTDDDIDDTLDVNELKQIESETHEMYIRRISRVFMSRRVSKKFRTPVAPMIHSESQTDVMEPEITPMDDAQVQTIHMLGLQHSWTQAGKTENDTQETLVQTDEWAPLVIEKAMPVKPQVSLQDSFSQTSTLKQISAHTETIPVVAPVVQDSVCQTVIAPTHESFIQTDVQPVKESQDSFSQTPKASLKHEPIQTEALHGEDIGIQADFPASVMLNDGARNISKKYASIITQTEAVHKLSMNESFSQTSTIKSKESLMQTEGALLKSSFTEMPSTSSVDSYSQTRVKNHTTLIQTEPVYIQHISAKRQPPVMSHAISQTKTLQSAEFGIQTQLSRDDIIAKKSLPKLHDSFAQTAIYSIKERCIQTEPAKVKLKQVQTEGPRKSASQEFSTQTESQQLVDVLVQTPADVSSKISVQAVGQDSQYSNMQTDIKEGRLNLQMTDFAPVSIDCISSVNDAGIQMDLPQIRHSEMQTDVADRPLNLQMTDFMPLSIDSTFTVNDAEIQTDMPETADDIIVVDKSSVPQQSKQVITTKRVMTQRANESGAGDSDSVSVVELADTPTELEVDDVSVQTEAPAEKQLLFGFSQTDVEIEKELIIGETQTDMVPAPMPKKMLVGTTQTDPVLQTKTETTKDVIVISSQPDAVNHEEAEKIRKELVALKEQNTSLVMQMVKLTEAKPLKRGILTQTDVLPDITSDQDKARISTLENQLIVLKEEKESLTSQLVALTKSSDSSPRQMGNTSTTTTTTKTITKMADSSKLTLLQEQLRELEIQNASLMENQKCIKVPQNEASIQTTLEEAPVEKETHFVEVQTSPMPDLVPVDSQLEIELHEQKIQNLNLLAEIETLKRSTPRSSGPSTHTREVIEKETLITTKENNKSTIHLLEKQIVQLKEENKLLIQDLWVIREARDAQAKATQDCGHELEIQNLRTSNSKLNAELSEIHQRYSEFKSRAETSTLTTKTISPVIYQEQDTPPVKIKQRHVRIQTGSMVESMEIKALRRELQDIKGRYINQLHELNDLRRIHLEYTDKALPSPDGQQYDYNHAETHQTGESTKAWQIEQLQQTSLRLQKNLDQLKMEEDKYKSNIAQQEQLLEMYRRNMAEIATERDLLRSKLFEGSQAPDSIVAPVRKYRSIPDIFSSKTPDHSVVELENRLKQQSQELSDMELELFQCRQWMENVQSYVQELEDRCHIAPGSSNQQMTRSKSIDVSQYQANNDIIFTSHSKPQMLDLKGKGWTYIDKRISIRLLKNRKSKPKS